MSSYEDFDNDKKIRSSRFSARMQEDDVVDETKITYQHPKLQSSQNFKKMQTMKISKRSKNKGEILTSSVS